MQSPFAARVWYQVECASPMHFQKRSVWEKADEWQAWRPRGLISINVSEGTQAKTTTHSFYKECCH